MRYFKFKPKTPTSKALKNEIKELNTKEKRLYRKAKILKHIGNVVFWIVFVLCMISSYFLISLVPDETTLILDIIDIVLSVLIVLLCLPISLIIAFLASLPFITVHDNNSKFIRQTLRSAVCSELRNFYGLCDPLLVTKCFDCTDNKFKNHDVCLFFFDGELRITTNLQYGFYNTNKDLGCYAFTKEEVTLSRVSLVQHEAAELTAGEFRMTMGIRAKGFIERNMLTETEK